MNLFSKIPTTGPCDERIICSLLFFETLEYLTAISVVILYFYISEYFIFIKYTLNIAFQLRAQTRAKHANTRGTQEMPVESRLHDKYMTYFTVFNMASNMDEDSEERRKSVSELLRRKEIQNEGNVEKEPKKDKNREEKCKLIDNAKVVEEVIANFSSEDSESETFQDAVEELNEKMNSCETSPGGNENEDDAKPVEEVAEEEERMSAEEKEV